jgi:hypothetical protein
MLLHQFKNKAGAKDQAAAVAQRPQRQTKTGAALLQKLHHGSKTEVLVKGASRGDVKKALSRKIYSCGIMLRARHSILSSPEGSAHSGPKWGLEPRPLGEGVEAAAVTPAGGLRVDAPVFDPSAVWSPQQEISLIASLATFTPGAASFPGVLGSDDLGGHVPGFSEAEFSTYYDMQLPEVPMWPFDPTAMPSWDASVPPVPVGSGRKPEGQDFEELEASTAASSGQPSSIGSSPVHTPMVDPTAESKAKAQVEYWLSPENLARDHHLRSYMDEDGWVILEILANFPRMAVLGLNAMVVAGALVGSPHVEVSWDSPPQVRRRDLSRKTGRALNSEQPPSTTPPHDLTVDSTS